jgi:hypothetical protein
VYKRQGQVIFGAQEINSVEVNRKNENHKTRVRLIFRSMNIFISFNETTPEIVVEKNQNQKLFSFSEFTDQYFF